MKLFVRTVDFARDQQRFTELLQRNLPDLDHAGRFDWLYRKNPAGTARSWFVCEDQSDRAVGVASVFPKFVWVGNRLKKCGQVGDFAVDLCYRSLGPALQLQKATLAPVDDDELAFCYDCPPHDRGMATFRRMGFTPVCHMARFARPLTANRAIQRLVPRLRPIHRPLVGIGNVLLRTAARSLHRSRGLIFQGYDEHFGDEFSDLDRRLHHADAVVQSRRFAEDLNWKYRRHPLNRYRVLTARRNEELQGFAVYNRNAGVARLLDLTGISEDVRVSLTTTVAEEARSDGVELLDTLVVHRSPEALLMKRAGFWYRTQAEAVVAYASREFNQSLLSEGIRWAFTAPDIVS